jgi:integrase
VKGRPRSPIAVKRYADGRSGFDYRIGDNPRVRVRCLDESTAAERAKEVALLFGKGRADLLQVSPAELAEFRMWKQSTARVVMLEDVLVEFIATKEADRELNPAYIRQLKGALKSFAAAFPVPIGQVTPAHVDAYLTDLKQGVITQNNTRVLIVGLFRFARSRDYLPDRTTAPEKVKRLKTPRDERHISVYSAVELRKIMASVSPEYLPWIALAAFAGVRTEEIFLVNPAKSPLRWEDFRWSEKVIALRGATTKTSRPRHTPIHPTLAAWLEPWRNATGDVMPRSLAYYRSEIRRLKQRGVEWKQNALRHTAISCRLAIVKNAAQVAEESGNSVAMIRRTYHNPRTIKEARAWYAVRPVAVEAGNVVRFRA